MRTSNVNVLLNQSTDFDVLFLVPSSDGPLNLTGYSFSGQMRETTDGPLIAEFQFNVLDQTVPANKGLVHWSLAKEVSETILASVANAESSCRQITPYLFDVNMTDSLGTVSRIIQGKVLVSPNVTQEVIS